jgi:hypothetical protein
MGGGGGYLNDPFLKFPVVADIKVVHRKFVSKNVVMLEKIGSSWNSETFL